MKTNLSITTLMFTAFILFAIHPLAAQPAEKPLEGKSVTIDPGHGGSQFGAVGVQGTKEKDINMAVARQLKEMLENAGAIVHLTLETDQDLSLAGRVDRHKEWGYRSFCLDSS